MGVYEGSLAAPSGFWRASRIVVTAQSGNNRDKLIDYLTNNLDRMDYKRYRKLGAGIIGSGAIESAHKTVVQERLKLSGQRWNKKGAQNVLNLRVAHKSGTWNRVVDLIKNPNKLATI